MSKFEVVAKADGVAEITIYDVIDRYWGISAEAIYTALKEMGDVKAITVRLNSNGGSVFEGTAIYNILKSHAARVTVKIDGLAASMASIVAMAGDDIEIGDGAYMMVHDPLGYVRGDADEMRDMADLLDKMRDTLVGIYARRTGRTEDEIQGLMKNETWMTAAEAVENGFANRSVAGLQIAAMAPVGLFEHPPAALVAEHKPNTNQGAESMAEKTTENMPKAATLDELKNCCPGANADFLVAQLDAQATAEQASRAWMGELQKKAESAEVTAKEAADAKAEAEKQAAEAKAEAENAKNGKPGVEMLGGGGEGEGHTDPKAEFEAAVDEKMKTGMNKADAVKAITKANPELHAAFVAAHNADIGPSTYRGSRG